MKLTAPRTRRLRIRDFPGAPAWLERLFIPLNELLEDLVQLGRVTEAYKTVEVTAKDAVETSFPFAVAHGLDDLPQSVTVAKVDDLTLPGFTPAGGVTVDWDLQAGGDAIVIRYISGLTAGHRYNIRLEVKA